MCVLHVLCVCEGLLEQTPTHTHTHTLTQTHCTYTQVLMDALISGLATDASPRQGVTCLSTLARHRVRPPKALRLQLYALLLPPLAAVSRKRFPNNNSKQVSVCCW